MFIISDEEILLVNSLFPPRIFKKKSVVFIEKWQFLIGFKI